MTSPPILERFQNPADFARVASPFLSVREAENNLLLGIASDLVAGASFGDLPPYLAIVRREGAVTAAGVRTPPFGVALSDTDDLEAVDLLAEDIQRAYGVVPGLLAPVAPATRFVARWESITPQRGKIRANERIHKCSSVVRARSPRGSMRPYVESDRQVALQWTKLFIAESNLPRKETDAQHLAGIDRRIASRDGGYFFWDCDGEVVSMAAAGGRTPNGVRIGPVYTPPVSRGKGYATALVADLTSLLLDRGMKFCFLFTDLANPVSNSIYAQIGYVPVVDCTMYDLEP